MEGFQLWANLPRSHKMMAPRYRGVESGEIPEVRGANGARIKVICGRLGDVTGPVTDIVTEPEYLDISLPAGAEFRHPTKRSHTVFAYVFGGQGYFCQEKNPFTYEVEGLNYFDMQREPFVSNGMLVLLNDGEEVMVTTEAQPVRFLLVSGKPIGEPVAWYGPIVMNTEEELKVAFEEYRQGTFIKRAG